VEAFCSDKRHVGRDVYQNRTPVKNIFHIPLVIMQSFPYIIVKPKSLIFLFLNLKIKKLRSTSRFTARGQQEPNCTDDSKKQQHVKKQSPEHHDQCL